MSRRVKILYIDPNSEIGGANRALLRLVAALDRRRYEPIVLLPQDGPMVRLFQHAGASVRFLRMEGLRPIPSLRYQGRYLARFWPTVARIARLIREERIDLVHTNALYSLYGGWAARFTGRPHVWHLREIPPAIPVARFLLGRLVTFLSAAVVGSSVACVRGLLGRRRIQGKVSVLLEGIDLNEFRPEISGLRIRRELGIDPDAPVMGFVARLDPWKGLDVFLRAAALLLRRFPNAHFIVSGGAPDGFEEYEGEMKALAASLHLDGRVHFLGWRYKLDDIPELMAALTVFSHTATGPEPLGLVLLEAMAMERPVVAACAGGPLEIITDMESGYLTPPGDAEAHAKAVSILLEDPARARTMGRAGRCRVEERFSAERFGCELDRFYDRVIGARELGGARVRDGAAPLEQEGRESKPTRADAGYPSPPA